ncbi:MAG: OPT/YSL family transporter [Eggerthellaceae bacterium]|nr:OPT/YSL family transporter [Eggerthellaceae bacterium]
MEEIKGQVTVRAMVIGLMCSVALTASSFFIALKSSALPWPIMFTSIVSMFILRALGKTSNKEITVMHTTMSAGAMVAGGFAFTIPAIYIVNPQAEVSLSSLVIVALHATILGLLFSSMFRRFFIEKSEMPFVMGECAAKVIKSNKDYKTTKIAIGISFGIASFIAVLRDVFGLISSSFVTGAMTKYGSKAGLNFSLMFPAVGYLIGPALALIWLLGACIGDLGFLLAGQMSGYIDQATALSLKINVGLGWMVGVGVAIIVKEIFPKIKNFYKGLRSNKENRATRVGLTVLTITIVLTALYFVFYTDMTLVALAIAAFGVWLTTVMSAQCVGQSAINPMEVFGIIVMAIVKLACPEISIVSVVFVAAIVAIASGLTGDIMNDFKSGQAFKTAPRAQVIAEAAGSVLGAVVVAVIFFVLVQAFGGSIFGSDVFPAAQSAAVAQLVGGVDKPLIFFGAVTLSLIVYIITSKFATLGLGIYLPANITLSVSVGAVICLIINFVDSRLKKKNSNSKFVKFMEDGTDLSFAAGLLAGEGVVGIVITVVQACFVILAL